MLLTARQHVDLLIMKEIRLRQRTRRTTVGDKTAYFKYANEMWLNHGTIPADYIKRVLGDQSKSISVGVKRN